MNTWLLLIIALYVITLLFDLTLDFINYKHIIRHGDEVPPEFKGELDLNQLEKSKRYSIDKYKFNLTSTIFNETFVILFILTGLLDIYNSWVASLELSNIFAGFIFFILISMLNSILDIPFNLFNIFKIEKKFNFNTMTPKLWLVDFIKGIFLSLIIMFPLICGALWIVHLFENIWWLPVWGFFLLFTVFILYISPYVLEPLFNKFTPIEDEELENGIKEVMSKAGLKISRVFKIDASKRTKHTNAYFSGIGKVKRIVLYDTLIDKLSKDEILAVLAHEAGHWKKKHIIKNLVLFEVIALIGIYLAFLIIKGEFVIDIFGIEHSTFVVNVFLLSFSIAPLRYLLSPTTNTISRIFEREADDFAIDLCGTGEHLATALIKLSKDNLSNIHPHRLYAKIHYSHPPVTERVRYLRAHLKR